MANPNTVATVEHGSGPAPEHEPEGALFSAPWFISLAMIVVIALMVWKKVPGAIGRALDSRIDAIRDQLAEAESLRKDAEALRAEYEARTKSVEGEAATILERAHHEAEAIVAQAKENAEALVERRQRMAEDKIAAEERAALDKLRAVTADATREAAARLIRERVDAKADEAIVGEAIRSVGSR